MFFWIIAILALIVQESFTTNIVIKVLIQEHRNIYLFTIIFLLAAIFDIILAYKLGKHLQKKKNERKVVIKAKQYIAKFELFIGKFGEKLFIILIALLLPPLLSAFISSWLKQPIKIVFLLIFLGDLIWYIVSFTIVVGINNWIKNTRDALIAIVIVSFLILFIQKLISSQMSKKP